MLGILIFSFVTCLNFEVNSGVNQDIMKRGRKVVSNYKRQKINITEKSVCKVFSDKKRH